MNETNTSFVAISFSQMEPENVVRHVGLSTTASTDEMSVMQSADAVINAEQAVALRSSSNIDHQPQSSSSFQISNVRTVSWETTADGQLMLEKSSEESLSGIYTTLTTSNVQKSPEVDGVLTCNKIVSRRSPRLVDKFKEDSLPDVITRLRCELSMPCRNNNSAANTVVGEVMVAGKVKSSETVQANSAGDRAHVSCRQRRWAATKCSSNSEEKTITCKEEHFKLDIGANDGLVNTNPEWLKPFDEGWMREVVIRNQISSATTCDVYYTAPGGKKLRSVPEISKYLHWTHDQLSMSCFTFVKRPIFHAPQEIVRSAGVFRGGHRKIENIKREDDSYSPNSDIDSCRKRKSLPSAVLFEHAYGKRSRTKATLSPVKRKAHKKRNSLPILKLKQEIDNLETTRVTTAIATTTTCSSSLDEKCYVTAAAQTCSETSNSFAKTRNRTLDVRVLCHMCYSCDLPSQCSQVGTTSSTAHNRVHRKVCSMDCPGQYGVTPFMECTVCMFLFHPTCAGYRAYITPFVCTDCYNISNNEVTKGKTTRKCPLLRIAFKKQRAGAVKRRNRPNPSPVLPRLSIAPQTASLHRSNLPSHCQPFVAASSSSQRSQTPSVLNSNVPPRLLAAPNMQLRTATSSQTTSVIVAPVVNIASSAINNISTGSSQFLLGTGNSSVICNMTPRLLVSKSFQPVPLTAAAAVAAAAAVVVPVVTKSIMSPAVHSNSAVQSPVSSVQPSLPLSSIPVNQVQLPPSIAMNQYVQFMLHPVFRPSANVIRVSPSSASITSRPFSAWRSSRPASTPCSSFANNRRLITLPSRVDATRPISTTTSGIYSTQNSVCIVRTNDVTGVVVPRVFVTKSLEEAIRPPRAEFSSNAGNSNRSPVVTDVDSDTKTTGMDELQRSAADSQFAVVSPASGFVALNCDVEVRRRPRKLSVLSPLKSLHAGVEIMQHIFRFLNVADLLRAAQVCRTWRSVIGHQLLWHKVRLERLLVTDWKRAASHFTRVATHHLDLRGMLSIDIHGHQWNDFLENVSELVTIRQIKFGLCPVDIVLGAVVRMCKLDHLSAECIMSGSADQPANFDVVKCARFSSLSHLKLRGSSCGLTVNVESDTEPLRKLDHLKYLSLTTLKLVPGRYLHFIGSLKQLEVLELGDCSCWDTETFKCLHHLTHLRSLRLELGGQDIDPGLGSALQHMNRLEQLELIRYVIPDSLFLVISSLQRLRVLSLWPYLCEDKTKQGESNLKLLEAVGTMGLLQQFEWGILMYGTLSGEPDKIPVLVPKSSSCLRKTAVEVNDSSNRNGDDSRSDNSGDLFINADDIGDSANGFRVEIRPGIEVRNSSTGLASDASSAVTMANSCDDPIVIDDSDNEGDVDNSVDASRVVKVEKTTVKSTAVADKVSCAFNAAVSSTTMFTFEIAPNVASGTLITGNPTPEKDSEGTKSVDNEEVCRQAVENQRASSDNSHCDSTEYSSRETPPSALVWRSINELVNELGVKLPNTKIRMFRVPEGLTVNRSS